MEQFRYSRVNNLLDHGDNPIYFHQFIIDNNVANFPFTLYGGSVNSKQLQIGNGRIFSLSLIMIVTIIPRARCQNSKFSFF